MPGEVRDSGHMCILPCPCECHRSELPQGLPHSGLRGLLLPSRFRLQIQEPPHRPHTAPHAVPAMCRLLPQLLAASAQRPSWQESASVWQGVRGPSQVPLSCPVEPRCLGALGAQCWSWTLLPLWTWALPCTLEPSAQFSSLVSKGQP